MSGLKSKAAQDKINKVLLNDAKASYESYLQMLADEKEIQGDEFCSEFPSACDFDYQLSYSVKYNKNSVVSIFIQDYLYTGGAHGMGWITTYNFNLNTGNEIKLTNILNTKSKITKVQKYAHNYIMKRPDIFFEDIVLRDVTIDNNRPFYYTGNGIAIVFQEYEVAPYSSGYPVVSIPSSVYK